MDQNKQQLNADDLDKITYDNEVTLEMLDEFRSEITCHNKLAKRYFFVSEGVKYAGLASPLAVVFCTQWIGFLGVLMIQLLLWLAIFIIFKKYYKKMRLEQIEVRSNWFFLQHYKGIYMGEEWMGYKDL